MLMNTGKKAKIAVLYAPGATSVLTIKAASINVCDLVFLYDQDCPENDLKQVDLIRDYISVYDISNKSIDEVTSILINEDVQGILTFSEYKLRMTSILSEKLGLIGNPYDVVLDLTDKLRQREILKNNNIENIKYAVINRENYKQIAEQIGFPSILKPREGAGSKWTQKVCNINELDTFINSFPENIEYVFEEYLEGAKAFQNEYYGDYVSVESIHRHGDSKQICITAKTPLTDKYAETGMFIPSPFSDELNLKILELEKKAIDALEVKEGITHTEIKLTDYGPRIIEVNGRLGGYVSEIIKRGMSIDLVKIALKLSIGESLDSVNFDIEYSDGVYYQIFIQADLAQDATIKKLNGIDEVSEFDDVTYVELRKNPGDFLSYRFGTENNIGIVYGESDSYKKFKDVIDTIRDTINIEYEYEECV